jgi:hypothetical protein
MPLPSSRSIQNHTIAPAKCQCEAYRNSPAPQAERNKSVICEQKTYCEIVADQAADKTSRREYRIQAGNMLLDGMRPLSQNQVQENET